MSLKSGDKIIYSYERKSGTKEPFRIEKKGVFVKYLRKRLGEGLPTKCKVLLEGNGREQVVWVRDISLRIMSILDEYEVSAKHKPLFSGKTNFKNDKYESE